jgi:deoxyadenosine/deoxycytidine kinase
MPEQISGLLEKFYEDHKYAFELQLDMLIKRAVMMGVAAGIDCLGGNAIIDRSLLGDYAICTANVVLKRISTEQFDAYLALWRKFEYNTRRPDHIIYLEISPEDALKRIAARGRKCEAGIDTDYLRLVSDSHNEAIATHLLDRDYLRRIPIHRINVDGLPEQAVTAAALAALGLQQPPQD